MDTLLAPFHAIAWFAGFCAMFGPMGFVVAALIAVWVVGCVSS